MSTTPTLTTAALLAVLRPDEGAIERLLGVVRRRGFRTLALAIVPDGTRLLALFTVSGERELDPLLRQIEKLDDVLAVTRAPLAT